jgi:hypothetical protein
MPLLIRKKAEHLLRAEMVSHGCDTRRPVLGNSVPCPRGDDPLNWPVAM